MRFKASLYIIYWYKLTIHYSLFFWRKKVSRLFIVIFTTGGVSRSDSPSIGVGRKNNNKVF